MWGRAGKKMLFMGGECGKWNEWYYNESLDWHLLEQEDHRKLQALVRELNRLYRAEPALWEADADSAGFRFVDADNADDNVIAFLRIAPRSGRKVLCVCNFSPVVRQGYRVGVPAVGAHKEIPNTPSGVFVRGNPRNARAVAAEPSPRHGF